MDEITDSRIKWKCRRGLLELDIVFQKFCQTVLPTMSDEEKKLFFCFLDTSDQVLLDWIFSSRFPESGQYKDFVQKLKRL
jgi:antitoxin CptB